jgi:pimeloyl-ACP methyl ester carboxylesterase
VRHAELRGLSTGREKITLKIRPLILVQGLSRKLGLETLQFRAAYSGSMIFGRGNRIHDTKVTARVVSKRTVHKQTLRPTILFIHGAGGTHKVWRSQTEFFKDAIAINLPGHGAGEGKTSIDDYVEEVRGFCDAQGLRNIVMIGASMGGAIAQKFALDHSEYLKALVLVSTGAKLRVNPVIFSAIEKDYYEAVELLMQFFFSEKAGSELKRKSADEMKKIKPEVTRGDFEACDKFNIMDRVKEINLPTLVICGLDDVLTPPKYSEYLKNNISGSKLEVIADAGHMVMREKPEEFNEKLDKFLEELGQSTVSIS